MTDFLLFLAAAALGLGVLYRGAPWMRSPHRTNTLDLTGHRWGDREQRS